MVHDDTLLVMFRELGKEEESEFLRWANEHSRDEIRAIHHPVIQDSMYKAQGHRLIAGIIAGEDTVQVKVALPTD